METTTQNETYTLEQVIAYAEGVAASGWKPSKGATDPLTEAYRLFKLSIECGEVKYRGSYLPYIDKKRTIAHEVITAMILADAQEHDDHLREWARCINLNLSKTDGNIQADRFRKRKQTPELLVKQASKCLGHKYYGVQFTQFYYVPSMNRWCATDGCKLAILPEGSCAEWDTTRTYNKDGAPGYAPVDGIVRGTPSVIERAQDNATIQRNLWRLHLSDLYNIAIENKVLSKYADAIGGLTSIEVDLTVKYGWVKYGEQYFNIDNLLPFVEYAYLRSFDAKYFDSEYSHTKCLYQPEDVKCAMICKLGGEVVAVVMPVRPIDDFNGVVINAQ